MRRVGRLVNIVHAQQRGRMAVVQLDDDLLGLVAKGRRATHRGCEHDAAARGQVAGLHHGPMHRPQEAVAGGLRHQRQVHVEEARLAGVDARAQSRVGLVRRAKADGVGLGQRAIERRAGGSAGEHADLEFASGLVLGDWRARRWPVGMAFGAPAGVKPLKPTVWPCSTSAAASSAESRGKEKIIMDSPYKSWIKRRAARNGLRRPASTSCS